MKTSKRAEFSQKDWFQDLRISGRRKGGMRSENSTNGTKERGLERLTCGAIRDFRDTG